MTAQCEWAWLTLSRATGALLCCAVLCEQTAVWQTVLPAATSAVPVARLGMASACYELAGLWFVYGGWTGAANSTAAAAATATAAATSAFLDDLWSFQFNSSTWQLVVQPPDASEQPPPRHTTNITHTHTHTTQRSTAGWLSGCSNNMLAGCVLRYVSCVLRSPAGWLGCSVGSAGRQGRYVRLHAVRVRVSASARRIRHRARRHTAQLASAGHDFHMAKRWWWEEAGGSRQLQLRSAFHSTLLSTACAALAVVSLCSAAGTTTTSTTRSSGATTSVSRPPHCTPLRPAAHAGHTHWTSSNTVTAHVAVTAPVV